MEQDKLFVTEDELDAAETPAAAADSRKFLIFMTDGLKLGVDAEYVVEIINNHTITHLPMLPAYIRGIINLRGLMVPIVDLRLRLGKEPRDNSLIIVLSIDGTELGLLVDSVDQMTDIPTEDLLPVPSHNNQQLVSGMCTLSDGSGTMMVLDCGQLVAHE